MIFFLFGLILEIKRGFFYCSLSRRSVVYVLVTSPCLLFPALSSSAKTKSKSPYDERRLLEQNKRIQRENNAPDEFPNFVREGLSFYYSVSCF